jgi:hypothetical protein
MRQFEQVNASSTSDAVLRRRDTLTRLGKASVWAGLSLFGLSACGGGDSDAEGTSQDAQPASPGKSPTLSGKERHR